MKNIFKNKCILMIAIMIFVIANVKSFAGIYQETITEGKYNAGIIGQNRIDNSGPSYNHFDYSYSSTGHGWPGNVSIYVPSGQTKQYYIKAYNSGSDDWHQIGFLSEEEEDNWNGDPRPSKPTIIYQSAGTVYKYLRITGPFNSRLMSRVSWSRGASGYARIYQSTIAPNNTPTVPGAISFNQSKARPGENITVSWGASSDGDGDSLTYRISSRYYDGAKATWSSWSGETTVSGRSRTMTIGTDPKNTKVQFRVRAYDGDTFSGYSGYRESSEVTIALPAKIKPVINIINNRAFNFKIETTDTIEGSYSNGTYGSVTGSRSGSVVNVSGTLKNISVGNVLEVILGNHVIKFKSITAPTASGTYSFY
ncbi:MAG: fibronectin type III domain-containing protein [Clostridia bacterium]|jgi:hypothetical protein|nr:fibronectin type III domain-containing protein [Clostridia bacterium]